MGGILHSQDLKIAHEETGRFSEQQIGTTALNWFNEELMPRVFLIPFRSAGYAHASQYTFDVRINPLETDDVHWEMAVYRQYDKLSNVGNIDGIGERVVGTWVSRSMLGGGLASLYTQTFSPSFKIAQGDYWLALMVWVDEHTDPGMIAVTMSTGITDPLFGVSYPNQRYLYAVASTRGQLPAVLTTHPAVSDYFLTVGNPYKSGIAMPWGSIVYAGDNFP